MNEAFEQLLISAIPNIDTIDFVEVFRKTTNGYGFNLKPTHSNVFYYYHTKLPLCIGDKYLIRFEKSHVCLDRLDVIEAIKVETFENLADALWNYPTSKQILINNFYRANIFNGWLRAKLIKELPNTPSDLRLYLELLPESIRDDISDELPLDLLPEYIDLCGRESNITQFLANEGLSFDFKKKPHIESFCRKKELEICIYFIELLK